jgi:bacteriorhodopsin
MSDKAIEHEARKVWAQNLFDVKKWGPACHAAITSDGNCMTAPHVFGCVGEAGPVSCRELYEYGVPHACATQAIEAACEPIVSGALHHRLRGYEGNSNGPTKECPYGNCGEVLGPHDIVGTTFYIACNMMLAFTLFFFVQVGVVPKQWRTSVSIAGLVTGVAWYNYTYMKEQWIQTQVSPTQYRYTDWLITVPLQIVEFYFILRACSGAVPASLGVRLFLASLVMVFCGWLAEIDLMAKVVGFACGMAGWLYILYEVFAGSAAEHAKTIAPERAAALSAFNTLKMIVSVGWCIYPIGFAIAYLCYFDQPAGVLSGLAMAVLNIVYNLADLINKGAFGLCVWSAAVGDKSKPMAEA